MRGAVMVTRYAPKYVSRRAATLIDAQGLRGGPWSPAKTTGGPLFPPLVGVSQRELLEKLRGSPPLAAQRRGRTT